MKGYSLIPGDATTIGLWLVGVFWLGVFAGAWWR